MPSVITVHADRPIGTSVVIVGAHSTPNGPELASGAEVVDAALGRQLLSAYRTAGGSGRVEDVVKVPTLGLTDYPLVVVAGLGPRPSVGSVGSVTAAGQLRQGIGAALRALPGPSRVRVLIESDAAGVAAIALGAMLGAHRFAGYKSSASSARPSGQVEITVANRRATADVMRRTIAVGQAVMATRDLVNTPPNELYPGSLAAVLMQQAVDLGIEVEVLDERALAHQGYRGLLAVGGGSARGPRLVRLSYQPARPTVRVALVGEGTTFNAGGLNLRSTQLTWAKAEMAGAAAVAGAVMAAARRKMPLQITATLPLVENLPSGTSYRPSDVVKLRSGQTVEVTDTEASGRIVVAEAIGRAIEDDPDYLLEVSTLAAAQRVALGPRIAAVMGQREFCDRVVAAGEAGGEAVWPMPMPADVRAGLDSAVADLAATTPDRWGAMIAGGAFLADFVPANVAWAHLDITGPAWNPGAPHGYTPKGGTGAGVVTIFNLLESIAATR